MALLSSNGSTLVWDGLEIRFGGDGIPVPVAFHQIQGLSLEMIPSRSLCPGISYGIRVIIPDVETDILFLTPNGIGGIDVISPENVEGLPSSNGILQFQALESPIYLNRPFSGKLGFSTGTFQLTSSADWSEFGYCKPLPIVLSNCSLCGCPAGSECSPSGRCVSRTSGCSGKVPCGFNNGKCPGGCPKSGYTCQNINGIYRCAVSNNKGLNLALFLGIIFFLVLLAILIGMAFASSMSQPVSSEPLSNEIVSY